MHRIEGFKNSQELATVCWLLALWRQEGLKELNKYETVENSVIVNVAEKCNRDKKELIGGKMPLIPRTLVAFAYFIFKPGFPERAETTGP